LLRAAAALLCALSVLIVLSGLAVPVHAQSSAPATFDQAQARTEFARTRMEAAQRKLTSLQNREKAAYRELTQAQRRYDESKVAADSATGDVQAAQAEYEEAKRRYDQEAAQLRRLYLENEGRRKARQN
jgi:predicted  nucleic acid-binding Zn-ribbon protein